MKVKLINFHYIIMYTDIVFSHGFYSAHTYMIRKHNVLGQVTIHLAHVQEFK